MPVITDTSPLNYLILIDSIDLLPRLYRQVILPRGALRELQHKGAPAKVIRWARALPGWIDLRDAPELEGPALDELGRGEREAIALAELYRHEGKILLLLDEQSARKEAAARQLPATGVLGILKAAAAQQWIDLEKAIEQLRKTNFRVAPILLQQLLEEERR